MIVKTKYCLLILAALPAFANAQTCRIVSLTSDGYLTWTNSPTNLYCGLLYARALDDCWSPASGYWNYWTSNSQTTLQLPSGGMAFPQLYLRLVCATNPLSFSFPQFQVPFAGITVDGNSSDWSGIQPAVSDRAGDAQGPAGSDLTAIYIARDTANAYVRIDVANGPPSSGLYFGVSFYTNATSQAGDRYVFVNLRGFACSVEKRIAAGSGYHEFVASGALAVQGNIIEASVPLSALNPPSPSFVSAWDDTSGPSIDNTCMVEARFP